MNAPTASAMTFTEVLDHAKTEMRAAFDAVRTPDGDPHPRLFASGARGLQTFLLPANGLESALSKTALLTSRSQR
jgi:hypothetical protein